ncbi:MAG TPA: 2-C-methyl-D-erythritol 4-phosphate cytidylyltransferase, partial [Candidatus Acidoferrales bacterium]|nr:2-C-methyl-D-erythritol 4-phosphate cytidylyltransferase [Candidatus Acidoferrales bacterium]
MKPIVAILPAAGLGTRMGAETPKQFLELEGTPILIHSVRRLASCAQITDIILATRQDGIAMIEEKLRGEHLRQKVRVVRGGDSRQESVANALREVPDSTEIVLVHDAVRPFVTTEQIARVIEEARKCGAAILGIPAMDTVKEVKRASLPEDVALITATIPRERVVLAQTPQAFQTKLLKEAFARAAADGISASDEAGVVERLGHDVHVVLGSERNIKITKPADM